MKKTIKKILIQMRVYGCLLVVFHKLRSILIFFLQIKRIRNVTRNDINYKLDLSKVIDLEIYLGGWEPQTIKFLKRSLNPGDVVIEAGANVGAHSLIIGKLISPEGHCYSFEPTTYAYHKLLQNIAANDSYDLVVTPEKYILTNHQMEMPIMEIKSSWCTDESLPNSENVAGSTGGISIDQYVRKANIQRVDLLKIDVDGYDYKVLCGAEETIKSYRPKIFIELAEFTLKEQDDSVRAILSFMHNLDYCGFYIGGGGLIHDYEEVLSISGPTSHVDAIFLSSELEQAEKEHFIGYRLS